MDQIICFDYLVGLRFSNHDISTTSFIDRPYEYDPRCCKCIEGSFCYYFIVCYLILTNLKDICKNQNLIFLLGIMKFKRHMQKSKSVIFAGDYTPRIGLSLVETPSIYVSFRENSLDK